MQAGHTHVLPMDGGKEQQGLSRRVIISERTLLACHTSWGAPARPSWPAWQQQRPRPQQSTRPGVPPAAQLQAVGLRLLLPLPWHGSPGRLRPASRDVPVSRVVAEGNRVQIPPRVICQTEAYSLHKYIRLSPILVSKSPPKANANIGSFSWSHLGEFQPLTPIVLQGHKQLKLTKRRALRETMSGKVSPKAQIKG